MKYRFLIGASVALATALSCADARAQLGLGPLFPTGTPPVWYFGGEGGWTSLENQTARTTIPGGVFGVGSPPIGVSANENFNDGFNVGVRGGIEWGPWRFEEEFNYRQNGVSSLNAFHAGGFTGGNVQTQGNRNAYSVMTNAIYDFSISSIPYITPHIGVGIGAVIQKEGVSIKGSGPGTGNVLHNTDTEFGYQAIAGIRYNINPALAFDIDYRYLASVDPSFRTSPALGNLHVNSGYNTNNLVASLTWKFGAPPPPPPAPPLPPAPPPAARKVFLVFFDWDKDTITPDGMAIIGQAADTFKAGGAVQIMVTGYTDRSGSAAYNQRLSERRANNVANAMVRMGVPRASMAVSGRGENDNRVPTANGVREPQNRRVEIIFP
jgi:outer membrane protein OmpA-like peptidoglycan-associated protein